MTVLVQISLFLLGVCAVVYIFAEAARRFRNRRFAEYADRLMAETGEAKAETEALTTEALAANLPVRDPDCKPMPTGYDMVASMAGHAVAGSEMGRDLMVRQLTDAIEEAKKQKEEDEAFYLQACKEAMEADPAVRVGRINQMEKELAKGIESAPDEDKGVRDAFQALGGVMYPADDEVEPAPTVDSLMDEYKKLEPAAFVAHAEALLRAASDPEYASKLAAAAPALPAPAVKQRKKPAKKKTPAKKKPAKKR